MIKSKVRDLERNPKVKKIVVISSEIFNTESKKVEFKKFRLIGNIFVTKEISYILNANRVLRKVLSEDSDYDLVLCNNSFLNFSPKEYNKNIKIISMFHALRLSFYKNLPKKTVSDNFIRHLHKLFSFNNFNQLKYSDKAFFVSRKTMEEAKVFYPEFKHKFAHKPNKVDKSKFFRIGKKEKEALKKKLSLKEENILLYVGRLDPLKGIDILAKTLEGIKDKSFVFLVIGDGPLRNKIKSYKFVRWLGKIDNDKLCKYYNIADLFLFPSLYENYPMTILEAKSCGCDILATDVGDNSYILNRNQIFDIEDPKDLEKKIRRKLK